MNVYAKVVAAADDLKDFIKEFDADLSGENGSEYTIPEAIQKGYDCMIDYYIANAKEEQPTIGSQIESVMLDVVETYHDYKGVAYTITPWEGKYVVSFAYKA